MMWAFADRWENGMTGPVQGPPGWNPPQPPPASPPRRNRPRAPWIAGGLVALLVVIVVAVVALSGGGKASAAQVQLEGNSTSGPTPFGAPAGTDQTGVTPPSGASQQQSGSTTALYSQNPNQPSCDKAKLTSEITGDQTKAAAWGAPLGVQADAIPSFISGLQAVNTRADTAVSGSPGAGSGGSPGAGSGGSAVP